MSKKKLVRNSINITYPYGPPHYLNIRDLGGSISAVSDGITGIVGAGVKNAELVDTSNIESATSQLNKTTVKANDMDSLMSEWGSYSPLEHVNWRDLKKNSTGQQLMNTFSGATSGATSGASVGGPVGAIVGGAAGLIGGLFGMFGANRRAKRKARELNKNINIANERALVGLESAAENIDYQNDLNAVANYAAYGGILNNMYSSGGGIHIKKANKGKFTDYCGGKVTSECIARGKKSSSPAIRKRAVFADNARKWNKYDYGGDLDDKKKVKRVDFDTYEPLYDRGFIPANMNQLQDSLINRGYNDPQRLAILASVLHETGGDPTAKNGIYKGMIQWGPDRYPSSDDVGVQIHELIETSNNVKTPNWSDGGGGVPYTKTAKSGFDSFWNSDNAYDATLYYNKGYVRPKEERARINRAKEAEHMSKHLKSLGGSLHTNGSAFSNGVTTIDNGGIHEENPNEGVQIGIDPNGVPNLVEEGEVKFNNYIFSNRIAPSKELLKDNNLPDKYANHSFADIAEKLSKESSERPNDPISKRGLMANMNRLMNSQEETRNDEMVKGNKYKHGGFTTYRNYTDISDDWYDEDYLEFVDRLKTDSEFAKPWINRINSGEFGDIGGNTFDLPNIVRLATDRKKGPVHNAVYAASRSYSNSPKGGGYPIEPIDTKLDLIDPNNKYNFISSAPINTIKESPTIEASLTSGAGRSGTDYKGDRDLSWLRYAPAIGSGINVMTDLLGLTNKPDYSNADLIGDAVNNMQDIQAEPIGNYLTYSPFDRDYYINKLNAQSSATRRALVNQSAGNRATAAANIIASDYNAQGRLGDLARQAEEYNLNQRAQVEGFNRGTNQFNSEMALKAAMANRQNDEIRLRAKMTQAQMRDQVNRISSASRSANLTNFFQNLGNIGIDEYNKRDRDMLLESGIAGTLNSKPKGWSDRRWARYQRNLNR